jgi:GAF domain-containing protein
MNESGNEMILHAASSEGGVRMVEKGYTLNVGTQEIISLVAKENKTRIALDVGLNSIFFNNPDLPMTRSEIALPLQVRGKILGVMDIHSDKPQAFNIEDIDLLGSLADQIAVAIDNARLLDESQTAFLQLEALTAVRTRDAWTDKLMDSNRVFTYTPLGTRAEKSYHPEENALTVPISLRGLNIGNLSMSRKDGANWNKLDENLIKEVAIQAGLAVDNIRLLEEATLRSRQEQVVGELAFRFNQALDIDSLLQTAARELGNLPDVAEVTVFVGQKQDLPSDNSHRSEA